MASESSTAILRAEDIPELCADCRKKLAEYGRRGGLASRGAMDPRKLAEHMRRMTARRWPR